MDTRKIKSDQEIFDLYIENELKKLRLKKGFTNYYLITKGLYRLVECDAKDRGAFLDSEDKKHWRKVPIDLTYDQYRQLINVDRQLNRSGEKSSIAGNVTRVIGIAIILIGIFIAIGLYQDPILGRTLSIIIGISSLLFGILYVSLGNIVLSVESIHELIEQKLKD